MKKNMIEKELRMAKKDILDGADVEETQAMLNNLVDIYTNSYDLTDEQIEFYRGKISSIEEDAKSSALLMFKDKISNIAPTDVFNSLKKHPRIITTTVALTLAASIGGCAVKSNAKTTPEEETPVVTEVLETTSANEVEEVIEETVSVNEVLTSAEKNITDMTNEAGKAGFFEDISEEAMEQQVKAAIEAYYIANMDEFSEFDTATLIQNLKIDSKTIYTEGLGYITNIEEGYKLLPNTSKIDFSRLYHTDLEAKSVQEIFDLANEYKTADKSRKSEIRNRFDEIKEDLLDSDIAIKINAPARSGMLSGMQVADYVTNGKVFTDQEDKAQIYTTTYISNCNAISGNTVEKSFESSNRVLSQEIVDKKYDAAREIVLSGNFKLYENYSIEKMVENIMKNLELDQYKEKEALNTQKGVATDGTKISDLKVGQKTTTVKQVVIPNILPENVPQEIVDRDTKTVTKDANGNDTTVDYLKAQKEGTEKGSADAKSLINNNSGNYSDNISGWKSFLNSSLKGVGSKPDTKASYETIKNYYYALTFNEVINSAISAIKDPTDPIFKPITDPIPDGPENPIGPEKPITPDVPTDPTNPGEPDEPIDPIPDGPEIPIDDPVPVGDEEQIGDEEIVEDTESSIDKQAVIEQQLTEYLNELLQQENTLEEESAKTK